MLLLFDIVTQDIFHYYCIYYFYLKYLISILYNLFTWGKLKFYFNTDNGTLLFFQGCVMNKFKGGGEGVG